MPSFVREKGFQVEGALMELPVLIPLLILLDNLLKQGRESAEGLTTTRLFDGIVDVGISAPKGSSISIRRCGIDDVLFR